MHKFLCKLLCPLNSNALVIVNRKGVVSIFKFYVWSIVSGAWMHLCFEGIRILINREIVTEEAKVVISGVR